jgi:uncharacterized protein (TIGR03083 family)
MEPMAPLQTAHLFLPLHEELLGLLRSLTQEEWERPTAAAGWSVRDMVAHLLDTDLRRLSFQRDGLAPLAPSTPIVTDRDLVASLDELNAIWVSAARRLSPRVLIALHELVGPQVAALFSGLDPFAPAIGVAWAGEQRSAVWFDTAREYTEKWLHQQHIRDAVGAPILADQRWMRPVLDTFVRGLPHTFRTLDAPPGTSVTLTVAEPLAESWTIRAAGASWQLARGADPHAAAQVTIDQDTAWRVFTKGLAPEAARQRAVLRGDLGLASQVLSLVAIMA